MPNPNALVGRILRLDPSFEEKQRGERAVILSDDRRAKLDPNDPRSEGLARVLDGAAKLGRPVYLEIDPGTGFIRRLLLTDVSRVARLQTLDDGSLGVLLEMSHAIRTLKIGNPDFAAFAERLREAERNRKTPLMVTFEDDGTIIDVRGFRPGPDGDLPPFPKPKWPVLKWIEDWFRWIVRWPIWPWRWWWWWWGCVSSTKAQQVFDAMAATTCAPLTVPAPCIPFLFPDDGCWARAHEMVRLMLAMGLKPYKVWIQGWPLNPDTKNHPNCEVTWGWHVAPTLCVRKNWFFFSERLVIDPALFATPVTKATWKGVQKNPNATLTDTDGTYYNWIWSQPNDPGYADTNYYLNVYRLALQSRSLQVGPPPYANCP
jgi:Glutaminase